MKKFGLFAAILGLFVASYFARLWYEGGRSRVVEPVASERIVTMAPSTGEVVFALGLGERVVGVSRYMHYPDEVEILPKIGGYVDVDLEALLRLQADAVVMLKEQGELAKKLRGLGVRCVLLDHMSVEGILGSINVVGEAFGKEAEAAKLVKSLRDRISVVRESREGSKALRVLFVIGREYGGGSVKSVVAAGAAGFHQELLTLAGVENAYVGIENFPQLTREHLIAMDPDVVIELVNAKEAISIGEAALLADWSSHDELKAVRSGRVHFLIGDQHFIPGPRFVDTLEVISSILERVGE